MSDVVLYQPRPSLDIAPDAWTLAQRIAATDFVPVAFRGKPEAVLAAILTGNELGIDALQSLAKIHVIEGKPAISAELMRALVLRAGHEFWVEEATATKCTVAGRRRGAEQISRVTWTMDDAKRAGLDGRQNWRKYPKQMLAARASSELARMAFPDVLAGVSYSVEELTDGDVVDDDDVGASVSPIGAPEKPKGNRRRAAKAATTAKAVKPEIVEPLPPLPGEDGHVGEFDTVEVVETRLRDSDSTGGESAVSPPDPAGGEPDSSSRPAAAEGDVDTAQFDASSPPAGSSIADARAKHIAIEAREAGIDRDDDRHAFIAYVTEGRARNGHELVDDEDFARVRAALVKVKRGELVVRHRIEDGALYVEEASPPTAEDPAWWSSDQWAAHAKAHGKAKAAVLRKAREIAAELGVPKPQEFAAWEDGRLAGQLHAWIEAA